MPVPETQPAPEIAGFFTHTKPVAVSGAFTKTMQCGKCGRDVYATQSTVMAFCRECSATMGVKK